MCDLGIHSWLCSRLLGKGYRAWVFLAVGSIAAAAEVGKTNAPLSAVTHLTPAVRPTRAQSAGTRSMVARLETLRTNTPPRSFQFASEAIVPLVRAELQNTTDPEAQLRLRFQLAIQLMQAGETESAIAEFARFEDSTRVNGLGLDRSGQVELRMRKAACMLRLGEQENCLLNHNPSSCLLPIQPEAYHKLPRGSRGAIDLLAEQLKEYPADLGARWLLNIAYMTLGEYPAKVPPDWVIPPQVFESEYPMPKFPDVAGALGIDVNDLAGGCVVDDFDNDGLLDLVVSSSSLTGQLRYFHNDGDGHFTEKTEEAGLIGLVNGLNVQQTDYNNDGYLDLWVMRGGWLGKGGRMPSSLLRNNGNGTFDDVTEEAGLISYHPSQSSVWFDYDGDGWLDLFVANETFEPKDPDPCALYHNNHDGTFSEVGAASGVAISQYIKGVTSADYDHDGRPDLYLSCRNGKNTLFHNDGPVKGSNGVWKFTNVATKAGVTEPIYSFPTWFFDYDNDGWEDLFVSGYMIRHIGEVAADYLGLPTEAAKPKLYHNNRDGTFTDVTQVSHMDRVCHTMGCNFGDLDNDGWLDFYLGTGDPNFGTLIPNRMFRNANGEFFQEVTSAGGFGHLQKGHGVAFADIDNDGNQDVYSVIGGAYTGDNYRNVLFLNPGNTNHWLKLKLEGTRSNRAAIGARIKVTVKTASGARDIYKTVNCGSSFGGSPLRQEIGLGQATEITQVEVLWPATGVTQTFKGLDRDHLYRLREGTAEATLLPHSRIKLDLSSRPHTH